ncbi:MULTISPECIES: PAS domain-containing hybrid sensor histidine kinase/response regulator [Pseudoalteromonas]|uniref:Sensor protein FixL n=1 Tax=Pseudoalteromonas amylolytica TaxID=1859457 RepID=A0A1S1MS98_9GAMM|nr:MULTISPECIES: PAS domain-containing hybrid sensor histidine kinase/response regulator [Pseudoalteromonas]OHU90013.1 hypothetical protein BET10_14635 [Pseudoalteromonas amylolytica]
MKAVQTTPYSYVVILLVCLCFSALYLRVTEQTKENSATTSAATHQTHLDSQLKLLSSIARKMEPKAAFLAWKNSLDESLQHTTSGYLITIGTQRVIDSTEQMAIDSPAIQVISNDDLILAALTATEPVFLKVQDSLFGLIKACNSASVAETQCFLYALQQRITQPPQQSLPQQLVWLLFAFILSVSILAYLKLRIRGLKKAIQSFPDPRSLNELQGDEFSVIEQGISSIEAQSNADSVQLESELHQKDLLSVQLKSQYSRLSAIINTVIDGVITIDKHGTVETFNLAAEKIFGYRANEVIGNNVKMLMPTPYQDEHNDYITNYLDTGNAKVIGSGREVLGQRADGALFPLELSVSEMNVDGERMFTGVVRDISEITEQKSLLSDQVSRTRAIIETVIDGIITINEYGVVDSFNPAAEKIFGYTEHEVIGQNIKMLMPAPYQQEHDTYLSNYRDTGIKKVIGSGREVLGRRKDGSVFPLSLSISEMNVGKKRMFTGIVRDITEQKKYEIALSQYRTDLEEKVKQRTAELETASQQAQAASQAKSKFLSRMSHELRTPLNAIIGFTQILDDELLTPAQQDSLNEISKAGKDLMTMVNEILQIATIQTGNLAISKEEVLLNDNIQAAINQLLPQAHSKHLTITFEQTTQIFVSADYTKLKQVITNILDNAIHFSHDGGTINLSLQTLDEQARVIIEDFGIGMSQDKLTSIFEPFERGSDAYSGEEGIGIGLTIASEFLQAMGGTITVESTEGEGTKFTVTVQLLREVYDCPSQASSILYIEDNVTNRKLMKRLINRVDNVEYFEAVDGASGIDAASQILPSIILLDINLPDMSGYDVFKLLKENDKTKNIPVVAVSANAMAADKEKATELGFTDYITKPIEMNELKSVLETLLI